MAKNTSFSHKEKSIINQMAVKVNDFYKDSIVLDLIQNLCRGDEKAVLICHDNKTAQKMAASKLLQNISFLRSHENQQMMKNKCMITDANCLPNKYQASVLMFLSPPDEFEYNQVRNSLKNLKYIIILYSSSENQRLLILQFCLGRKFVQIEPPKIGQQQENPHQNAQMYRLLIKNFSQQQSESSLWKYFKGNGVQLIKLNVRLTKKSPNRVLERKKVAFALCKDQKSYKIMLDLDQSSLHSRILVIQKY